MNVDLQTDPQQRGWALPSDIPKPKTAAVIAGTSWLITSLFLASMGPKVCTRFGEQSSEDPDYYSCNDSDCRRSTLRCGLVFCVGGAVVLSLATYCVAKTFFCPTRQQEYNPIQ